MPEIDDDERALLAFYTTLRENVASRASYGRFLTRSYKVLETGEFPGVEEEDPTEVANLQRALHLSLCTELYKAGEILVALCRSASSTPNDIPEDVIDIRGHQVDDFLERVEDFDVPADLLGYFPLPDPSGLELEEEQEDAAEEVVEMATEALKASLEFYDVQREHLKPFRHKFSHSYAVVMGGNPISGPEDAGPGLPIPVLEGATEDAPFSATSLLFSNQERTAQVLRMLETMLQLELDLLRQRALTIANGGEPPLPPSFTALPSQGLDEEQRSAYEDARESMGYGIREVNVEVTAEPGEALVQEALDFYDRTI